MREVLGVDEERLEGGVGVSLGAGFSLEAERGALPVVAVAILARAASLRCFALARISASVLPSRMSVEEKVGGTAFFAGVEDCWRGGKESLDEWSNENWEELEEVSLAVKMTGEGGPAFLAATFE